MAVVPVDVEGVMANGLDGLRCDRWENVCFVNLGCARNFIDTERAAAGEAQVSYIVYAVGSVTPGDAERFGVELL